MQTSHQYISASAGRVCGQCIHVPLHKMMVSYSLCFWHKVTQKQPAVFTVGTGSYGTPLQSPREGIQGNAQAFSFS